VQFTPLAIDGAVLIELEPHRDDRGFFARSFCADEFAAHGLPSTFPQTNLSRNDDDGTLRGMHVNTADHPEAKVVRCVRGAIHDVIIDLREDSPTRHHWLGVALDHEVGRALFVPAGCAHGFVTLQPDTDVWYLMSAPYAPGAGRGLRWDDPFFAIDWPRRPAVIAERDATYPDYDPAEPPTRP
jgi:dTDP-4-dehydrorhamnose 3,5-epimerase